MILSIAASLALLGARPPKRPILHPMMLVPTPQHVIRAKGGFNLTADTNIVFNDAAPDDRFAAEQLMEEILTDVGVRIEPTAEKSRRAISLVRTDTEIAPTEFGQGYRLTVTPTKVTIAAHSSEGIFYGVQTLKQLIRANLTKNSIPACTITDWPTLKYRGWQDDISRGPIPTYGFLMKQVRILSEFKVNMLTLYTEHVFKLKKHPTIAPSDGITAEEIAELSSYAKQYHVEVVGNFQSFGHFRNILKLPEYSDLAETPSVLSPALDESYKFLGDVYSEVAPAYTSKLFNINCDEVSGLGNGPSKELVQKIGVGGVYARHINRVTNLLRKYGKTPMMWGDIALNYPDIVPQLPKDLIVLPWAYDGRASFDNQIQPFTKFGLQFMVCPGVSCWNEIWPNLDNATVNISNFVRDGAKNGAIGCLNTAWDDDGLNFFNDNWFEFVWGAECSWKPIIPSKRIDPDVLRIDRFQQYCKAFPGVFYGLKDAGFSEAIIKLSQQRTNAISGGLRNSAIWRDPVTTFAKLPAGTQVQPYMNDILAISFTLRDAKAKAIHNAPTLDYAIYATRIAKYLGDSMAAAAAAQAGNRTPLKTLSGEVIELRDWYSDLWQRENRPWWLERNIAKFDDLASRVQKL